MNSESMLLKHLLSPSSHKDVLLLLAIATLLVAIVSSVVIALVSANRKRRGVPFTLTYLFMPDANAAMTALVDGTCDVLDPSINLDGQVALLQQMQTDGQAQLLTAQSNTMEWLGFGILHASYDNGFNSTGSNPDRPDLFGDAHAQGHRLLPRPSKGGGHCPLRSHPRAG